MQQFLVIQTAFIGDVVLATGILEKLHAYFPDAAIDFLVRKGNESLLDHHPFLREVLVWNKQEQKLKNLWRMGRIVRSRKYNKVINIQRFAATGWLTAFSGAQEKIGFDKNPLSFLFDKKIPHRISTPEDPLHERERNNLLIAHFTDNKIFNPQLYPSQHDREKVRHYQGQPYVCIAPASVWFTKQYTAKKWVDLIKKIPEHLYVYLIGAPSDNALCKSIVDAADKKNIVQLCGQLNFLQSAALMKGAVMNYVNDSAPMHFASSVNAPVTAVYCSTLPSFGFGPLSKQSRIVQVQEKLPCRPCGLHGKKICPLGHFDCANKIKTQQLLETLNADGKALSVES
jgi:ADP-heptose:LPS heptosyltransferase